MSENSTPADRLIISFVSGKGGVGKTMLTVACARELSLSNRTLLVDLDFFNRGLTGLLGEGISTCCVVEKPGFLSTAETADSQWKIVEVAPNLFHICYPDLSTLDMQKFETLDVEVLKESLREFVAMAADKCKCECVVIDCHGGPDNSSFAACLMSRHSILVSEPDRITFYGTLNFLRQLKQASQGADIDLHLVFNKVVPAFSGVFLTGFYNRLVRGEFGNRPLLAIFPLEVYLTKEFERTPFLTSVYPFSWLARKSRLMLYDLLNAKKRKFLAPAIRTMPRVMRAYRRTALGRPFPLLNLNVIMPTIVSGVVLLALFLASFGSFFSSKHQKLVESVGRIRILQCAASFPKTSPAFIQQQLENAGSSFYYQETHDPEEMQFVGCVGEDKYHRETVILQSRAQLLQDREDIRKRVPDPYKQVFDQEIASLEQQSRVFFAVEEIKETIEPYLEFLGQLAAVWLILALLTTWTVELDKRFTYYFRLRRHTLMAFFALTAVALWFGPLVIVAAIASPLVRAARSELPAAYFSEGLVLIGLSAVTFAAILSNQLYRVYRDSRYEGHYFEDILRVLFLGYLLAAPALIHRLFMQ